MSKVKVLNDQKSKVVLSKPPETSFAFSVLISKTVAVTYIIPDYMTFSSNKWVFTVFKQDRKGKNCFDDQENL